MREANIAIVGAGIVGCMIAREIVCRDPDASVVVLDRVAVGSGATQRSAGLHFPRGATARVRQLTGYSQRYYERLKQQQPSLPIHQLDMFVVAATTAGQLAEAYLDSASLVGTRTMPDGIRLPEHAQLWRGRGCQYADVPALTAALALELRHRVAFWEGVRVTGIEAGDHATVRLGTGQHLTVDRVVLAPGPWLADPAWSSLVAGLGARVKKVVAAHVEQPVSGDEGVIIFQDEDAFLLPLRHRGHWLFSYTSEVWDVDPETMTGDLTSEDLDQARRTLGRYAPELAERCVSGRAFCDAYSENREPLVRVLDDTGRVLFAGATNGSGYRLAPAIASEAVDLLLAMPGPGRPR